MKRTDLLDAGEANRVDDATIATRRQVLKRIALGAMVTVGSPWVMAQAIGTGFLRGNCRRDDFPTWVDEQAACSQPPSLNLGSGMFTYTPAFEDPMTTLHIFLGLILGSVPVFGPLLGAILNLLWPQSADPNTPLPDLWSLIKQQVIDLIDAKIGAEIQAYYQGELTNVISGFNTSFDSYRLLVHDVVNASAPTPDQIEALKSKALFIQNYFENKMAQFTGIPGNGGDTIEGWKVLPLYVQAANLHITFLYDLIRNASSYGIDAEWLTANVLDVAWRKAIDSKPTNYDPSINHLSYVAATLATAMQTFEDEYTTATKGDSAFTIYQFDDNSSYINHEDKQLEYGALIASFFGAAKVRNGKVNRYTVAVSDILEAWKHLPDPLSPPARRVTPFTINRILWCGPYGLPDAHDIGIDFAYTYGKSKYGFDYNFVQTPIQLKSGKPIVLVVPNPADHQKTPDGLLTHIHFDEIEYETPRNNSQGVPNFRWRLPLKHELSWNNDPPVTSGRYNLAIDKDHPVIKVNIHTCDYRTPESYNAPYSFPYYTAGTLIGGLEFVQENVASYAPPPAPAHGVDWPDTPQIVGRYQQVTANCCDGTKLTLRTNNDVETASLDGHILCDIYRSSDLANMWIYLGQNVRSIGTIMFGFRPKNPDLYPSVGILSNTYVVSPKAMTVDDIVDLGTRWYASRGVTLSAAQLAQLKDAIVLSIKNDDLQARRDAFWSRG